MWDVWTTGVLCGIAGTIVVKALYGNYQYKKIWGNTVSTQEYDGRMIQEAVYYLVKQCENLMSDYRHHEVSTITHRAGKDDQYSCLVLTSRQYKPFLKDSNENKSLSQASETKEQEESEATSEAVGEVAS